MSKMFKRGIKRPAETLQDVTVRDFSGGWNVVDDDLNLKSKFAKLSDNMFRAESGGLQVRWGTRLFADVAEHLEVIINVFYYDTALVAVGSNGKIVAVKANQTLSLIWDSTIAAALPGAPQGWTNELEFCSGVEMQGKLIICNGIDKPVWVTPGYIVEYVNDPATGSNANVPICRYVISFGGYCIMAGDPIDTSRVHYSHYRSPGTWFGDAAPNEATFLDTFNEVPVGSPVVRGLSYFRDRLVIGYERCNLIGTVGDHDTGGNHVPTVGDPIANYGLISHHTYQPIGDDLLFLDNVGVPGFRQSLLSSSIRPNRISQLIDPEIRAALGRVSSDQALLDRVFSIYNQREGQYMLFIPSDNGLSHTSETRCFSYQSIPSLKIEEWRQFRGWNWRCGCLSALKRVFLCRGSQIYILGNRDDPIYADYELDQETFDDGTVFLDGTGFDNPEGDGVTIHFDWIFPWSDLGERRRAKHTKYLTLDTKGTAPFTAQMFIDNVFELQPDLGQPFTDDTLFTDDLGFIRDQPLYDPTLEMEFVGGDAQGFGNAGFGAQFGGGRNSGDERLYAWNSKFDIFRMRFFGDVMEPLRFISVTVSYTGGSIRR